MSDRIDDFERDIMLAEFAWKRDYDQAYREAQIEDAKNEALEMLNLLNQKLIENNRIEDLKRASFDKDYQQLLLKEFGLED